MSLEDTENIVKKKLMDILDEELSTLTLEEIKKTNGNIYANDNHPNDNEKNADKESFSSSSDTTAESSKEIYNSENEVENKVKEDLNPPSENVGEETERSIKYQHQENEPMHKKEAIKLEKSAEIVEPKTPDNQPDEIEDDAEKFIPPSDSVAKKIKERVEFYFEDYNLFKNSFLLGHIRRNKKGYVTLKLVASLRKIKSLTKDFRTIAYSLRDSKVLELNPENNKLRRIEPIPKTEDTSYGKTLMVFNIPPQNFSMDNLKEMFSKFGTVVSAGVYEIGSRESDVYHERCLYFHRKIASKVYGIVEFEKYDEVVKALKDEEGHLPKENEVMAVPLLPQIYNKEKKHLKFLKTYNPNPKRGYERYRPRNDFYPAKGEATGSGEIMRNEKMNMRGGYIYKRGYFRRSYRGRKPFMPSNTKNFADDYMPREWSQPYRGMPKKWGENRQLRANNSLNVDRLYPSTYRKKTGNGYISNGIVS